MPPDDAGRATSKKATLKTLGQLVRQVNDLGLLTAHWLPHEIDPTWKQGLQELKITIRGVK